MDKYRIDSHKLIYHVDRVSAWLGGDDIYPIYMEVSPSGACNHRCSYCALDFMEYQQRFLPVEILKERLGEMGRLGVRSIMYAGEGEPFLHPDMAEIAECTRAVGIDAAITTNGVLFGKELAERVLGACAWIKISINGATAKTYAAIHRCREGDFETVLENLRQAAAVRREKDLKCALGMQLLLLPENQHEAAQMAELAKEMGMDYLVIKPYSQHPLSMTEKYKDVKYGDYEKLAERLAEYNDENFQVIYRAQAMQQWDEQGKGYERCLALPFWSYVDAGGNVWGCSMYMGDERWCYGNIKDESFEQIWQGERRQESLCWAGKELDAGGCRVNCRMESINRYLWELKHLPEHANFI